MTATQLEQEGLPVYSYGPEAVLNVYQVANWLQVSYKKIDEMPIKAFWLGNRRRYLAKHVLEFMEEAAK